jgi:hypothetical protein
MATSDTGKYLNSPYGFLRGANGDAIMNGRKATLVEVLGDGKVRIKFGRLGREYDVPENWLSDRPIRKMRRPGQIANPSISGKW